MPLDKEKVQDLIDDFVVTNVDQINEVATDNPMLYGAVIDALNLLSRKFGTIQAINIPKPAAPIAQPLDPIFKVGAEFKDTRPNKLYTFVIDEIDYDKEFVSLVDLDGLYLTSDSFSRANDNLKRGHWVYTKKANALHPSVQMRADFVDNKGNEFRVARIDFENEEVEFLAPDLKTRSKYKFSVLNNLIERGGIKLAQPKAPKLNPLVEIGAEFIEGQSVIKIEDIDYDKEEVMLSGTIVMGTLDVKFYFINDKIESGKWVLKTQTIPQSNTFGALTLNPSVKVGQLYLDLEDDSNFSVVLIDQNKQVVTIYWNEDDLQGEVDFEDFNDNLEAATWVLAPNKTQGPNTEAEILEAIEGLELIDDDESKKEIAELKKQLKQLKKKKP